jgi:integrase/recombinase XerD
MTRTLTMLARAESYLAERRRLGFKLDRSGTLTLAFARFADASGHEGPLDAAVVLRWAKEKALHTDPFTWAGRVNVLRPFARYLADREPATQFPEDSPFGRSKRRLAPHIYTPAEVEALVSAAGRLPGRLTPVTYSTLFGFLAATGLRISEALRLACDDLDAEQGQLTVRHAKFQRSRLVALHPTAAEAMRRYLRVRARHGAIGGAAPLFLSENTGQALRYGSVRAVFLALVGEIGIRPRGGHELVRVHDLRHTFICRRLLLWERDGADLGNAMMALSTYVGHVNVADTYWYLEAVPELMTLAGERFEALGVPGEEARHG